VAWARTGIVLAAAGLVAGLVISGGTSADPPVPRGFPGVLPAFMGGPAGAGARSRRDVRGATERDRRWLGQAKPLGEAAPGWARRLYRRSLLVLRGLVARDGAAVAGARPGWAYVWPRDAGAVAIALASAGYRAEARRIARFLLELDLAAGARFHLGGEPVAGRGAQGDAAGWVTAAARAAGIRPAGSAGGEGGSAWRDRADYQEGGAGDDLGNALAAASAAPRGTAERRRRAGAIARRFGTPRGLVRVAGDPGSGLDTAGAWAIRPFPLPALHAIARRTLLNLVAGRRTRFGLLPSEGWTGGEDPWTAPTAWCAWSLAALWRIDARAGRPHEAAVDRRAALSLMTDLRRDSTRHGLLPERVDAQTGAPTSTTPLAWSHAFAILAIRQLWPGARR